MLGADIAIAKEKERASIKCVTGFPHAHLLSSRNCNR